MHRSLGKWKWIWKWESMWESIWIIVYVWLANLPSDMNSNALFYCCKAIALFYCCKAIQIATLPGDSKVISCSQVDPSKSGRFSSEQRINKLEVLCIIISVSFLFQGIMHDIETLLHIAFQAFLFSVFKLVEVYLKTQRL